jgi:tetratricopeptide (TPR) repeat protein
MAALAADLRSHLADLPLTGVCNRSLVERWQKWRRRRPHGVALAGMTLAVLLAAGAVVLGALSHFNQRLDQARAALNDGKVLMAQGQWEGAMRALERGRDAARGLPWQHDLATELDRRLRLAEEGQAAADRDASARELSRLADHVRFLYTADSPPPEALRGLAERCRAFWEKRRRVVERLRVAEGRALAPTVRDDLLDLAIFWADLQVRLAPPAEAHEGRRQALVILAQAESLCGPSPVLDQERRIHGGTVRGPDSTLRSLRTAWEHYALGRALLRSGDLQRAAEEVRRAVRMQPQGLWPNFYQGLCAYRQGRYAEAVTAYSVCIGAAPVSAAGPSPAAAGCLYNRALAFAALGQAEEALLDYEQALRLDPTLAHTALSRESLLQRVRR